MSETTHQLSTSKFKPHLNHGNSTFQEMESRDTKCVICVLSKCNPQTSKNRKKARLVYVSNATTSKKFHFKLREKLYFKK